jgi:branched-chain amino acid transport system permease protein
MTQFLQQLVNGLSVGSMYAVLALGLSMVYGTLGILNFAYGELIAITGYTMYFATQAGLSFALAAVLGALAAAVASVLMQQLVFRPLQGTGFVTLLFASFALSEVLQGIFRQAISPRAKGIPSPDSFSNTFDVGPLRISTLTLITLVVAVVSLALFGLFMRRSRYGLQMRAAALDLTTTRLQGIPAGRVILLAFALSGILAGVAGVLWISRTDTVTPTTGATPILVAFVAVVLGGLGSTVGAVVGGFAFGLLEVFLEAYLPSAVVPFQFAFALIAVALVLYARPEGLFGKAIEVKV